MAGYLNLTGKILLAQLGALAGLKVIEALAERQGGDEPRDPHLGLTPSLHRELRGYATEGDHEGYARALRREGCPLSIEHRSALWRALGGT